MLDLATATHDVFQPCLNQAFDLPTTNGRITLTLTEVRPLGTSRPGASRQPFALTFRGAPTLRLPQQIRRLEHATLGAMDIFLVQTGANATGSDFEAVFN
jgi:hypothetical protein